MKKLLAATMLAGFVAAAPAFAQDTMTPAEPPAATTTDPTVSTESMPAPDSTPVERFITMEAPNDWMASELIGSTVYGPAEENLGNINDLVADADGRVKAVVIGVGGFLGIGEKNVAVAPTTLERLTDADNNVRYRLTTTKEELNAAPEFVFNEDVTDPATTSTVPATDPIAPAPAPMDAPATMDAPAATPAEPLEPTAPVAPSPTTP